MAAARLGAVGLGLGTALGFVGRSTFDDANADGHCDADGRCDAIGLGLRDDAVAKGNLGTAIVIAGAVLAAGSAVLQLTARRHRAGRGRRGRTASDRRRAARGSWRILRSGLRTRASCPRVTSPRAASRAEP